MSPGAPLEQPLIPSNLILYYSDSKLTISDVSSKQYCHNKYNFLAVFSGEASFEIDDKEFHLHANEAILVSPFSRHRRIFWSPDYQGLYASFQMPEKKDKIILLTKKVLPLKKADWKLLRLAVEEFLNWYHGNAEASAKTVLRMAELLNNLCGRFAPNPATADHRNYEKNYDEKLRKMIHYIHEHLDSHITIDDLAACLNLSRSTVRTLFKKQMKCSIGLYIRSQRLSAVGNFLRGTTLTLSEIAVKTGYDSGTALSRAVKRDMGKTPSRIRHERHNQFF